MLMTDLAGIVSDCMCPEAPREMPNVTENRYVDLVVSSRPLVPCTVCIPSMAVVVTVVENHAQNDDNGTIRVKVATNLFV